METELKPGEAGGPRAQVMWGVSASTPQQGLMALAPEHQLSMSEEPQHQGWDSHIPWLGPGPLGGGQMASCHSEPETNGKSRHSCRLSPPEAVSTADTRMGSSRAFHSEGWRSEKMVGCVPWKTTLVAHLKLLVWRGKGRQGTWNSGKR